MGRDSDIEWTDNTWSPVWGCTEVSKAETGGGGCDNCYARTLAHRFGYGWNGEPMREFGDDHWDKPLRWNRRAAAEGKRTRVFPSMCDPFDKNWPAGIRERFWALIEATPSLDWLLLTKRIGNVRGMVPARWLQLGGWPANVWLGATVVNQDEADRDVPKLLAVPAWVRFLSIEPMLGPIRLRADWILPLGAGTLHALHWIIAGGESGPHARPPHPDWFRGLRDQCAGWGLPFMFKQWGEWWEADSDGRDDETGDHRVVEVPSIEAAETFDAKTDRLVARDGRVFASVDDLPDETPCRHMTRLGKKAAGRLLDGIEHNGFPAYVGSW